MTLKDLYDWLAPQFDGPVRLGSLDGQAERFLALYDAAGGERAPAHICLGGAERTHWDELTARLVLRWGSAQPAAEAEARRRTLAVADLVDALRASAGENT